MSILEEDPLRPQPVVTPAERIDKLTKALRLLEESLAILDELQANAVSGRVSMAADELAPNCSDASWIFAESTAIETRPETAWACSSSKMASDSSSKRKALVSLSMRSAGVTTG